MNSKDQHYNDKFERLREKAKHSIGRQPASRKQSSWEVLELINELEIHQIELEIQNEELQRTQQELADLYKKFSELYEFAPCGYLSLDTKGMIRRINLAGMVLLDSLPRTILRTGFSSFLAAGYQNLFHSALATASNTGQKQSLEMQLATVKDLARWVWAEIEPKLDANGQVVQWRMTLADISSKKEVEAALEVSEKRYRRLFDAMVSSAVVFEIGAQSLAGKVVDIRFVAVNAAFKKLTGLDRDQVVGKTLRELWPDTEPFWFDQIDQVMSNGQAIAVEGFHQPLNKHFLFSAFRLDDTLFGATFSDISIRVRMEEALKKAGQSLKSKVRDRQAALEDANIAVKVLLKQGEKERQEQEEKILSNIIRMTRPHLDRLAASNLSRRQQTLLDAVNASLDHLTSPLNRRFMIDNRRLTPTESRVADLVRQGKSTKSIAEIMGVATSTIDFHRHNIRRKLDLHRGTNLESYLNSLE